MEMELVVFLFVTVLLWPLPAIIAFVRGSPIRWPVFWLTLLLGWNIFGFAAAMVMAVWPKPSAKA